MIETTQQNGEKDRDEARTFGSFMAYQQILICSSTHEIVHCAQCFTAIHDNILCLIYAFCSYSDTLITGIVVKHLLRSKPKIQDDE
ncbi:hypothetical protein EYC80_008251 [Monilinia laxa]|uniref:Uncharacterized protein n=1 Tax=Monilinia laxa TaxID=61186 RepID=A0A5N6JVQ4_MONLA|nr:hypothetical protein EYC80_008251 [Monilinia laxa]